MYATRRGVLLVDDDRLILELYAMALRERGFVVHTAGDPTTARAVADRVQPELACVDGRLATGSGIALARDLAASGVRVVIFTNDQALYDRTPAGVVHRLIKVNTSPHDLAVELERLLRGQPVAGPGRPA